MKMNINEVDRVEVLTLQDNYVDVMALDEPTETLQRPIPVHQKDDRLELKCSPLAEHGFSSLITVYKDGNPRSILFDFGWSEDGASRNVKILDADLSRVDSLALSHGHIDHFGGLRQLYDLVGKPGIDLILHPAAFRNPRYGKVLGGVVIHQPPLTRESLHEIGVNVHETKIPCSLLDDDLLFLTAIPRETEFEKGMPNVYYQENGQEKWDPIDDDSSIVANVKGKGLVILSGCCHAGIINTIEWARKTTGMQKIHAVMGGFHLTGKDFIPAIEPTTAGLKAVNPDYIIPTHCTGKRAIEYMEKEMPDQFLLNMSGTKVTFSGA